jgi:hypothetical protein
MYTTATRRFARYLALPIVSAGIIGPLISTTEALSEEWG